MSKNVNGLATLFTFFTARGCPCGQRQPWKRRRFLPLPMEEDTIDTLREDAIKSADFLTKTPLKETFRPHIPINGQ
ncbi:MAG: hypothetical protein LBG43_10185 [Treponema sp.]|nr:hypothetical protein [Treponema sp.]